MSWSFRSLILGVVLAWAVAPQLACFMPEQTMTKAEMDCCEQMANECGGPNMSHACCGPVTRIDIGITAKVVRDVMPLFNVAQSVVDFSADLYAGGASVLPIQNDHAPPPEPAVSSSILRI